MNPLVEVDVLRIFVGETAQRDGRPLYELLIEEARKRGMAGATAMRGLAGFGANSLLHTARLLRLSEDLPVVVEIVDTPARIADFLPVADALLDEGTLLVEKGRAVFHMPLRIRDAMSPEVATALPGTPLSALADLLLTRGVKALPVMEGGRVVGIITGGDLMARANMPLRLDIQGQLPESMRAEHLRCLDCDGLTAKDVMSAPVEMLNIRTRLADALDVMARKRLKRLPVVADDGALLGIVSRADVLRVLAKVGCDDRQPPTLPPGLHRTARDVMFTDIPTAAADTPLEKVLQQLLATPLRRVVVVDAGGKVAGLVLDRDLVATLAKRNHPGLLDSLLAALSGRKREAAPLSGTAGEVMTRQVFTLPPETPLAEVVRTLVERQAKRLVVADAEGRLLGMVDRDAVLRALAQPGAPA